MPDILHRVGIKSSTKDVYKALATIDGLSGWWTSTTKGDSKVGGNIHFQFGDRGFFDTKVLELDAGKRVAWRVTEGPAEWIGTTIGFDLKQEGEQTTVLFKHKDWKEPVEFMLRSLARASRRRPVATDRPWRKSSTCRARGDAACRRPP